MSLIEKSKTTGAQSNDAVLSIGNYAKIDLTRQSRAGFPEVVSFLQQSTLQIHLVTLN